MFGGVKGSELNENETTCIRPERVGEQIPTLGHILTVEFVTSDPVYTLKGK